MLAGVLSVVAAFAYTCGLALQQKANLETPTSGAGLAATVRRVVLNRWWLAGFGLGVAGFVVHGVALALGSLTAVQVLQVSQIAFMVPLGAWVAGIPVHPRDAVGAALVGIGLVGFLVALRPSEDAGQGTTAGWIAAAIVGALAVGGLLALSRRATSARAALLGLAAGLLYGIEAATLEVASDQLAAGVTVAKLVAPAVWATLILAVAAVFVSNLSLRAGSLAVALSTITLSTPVASTIIAVAVFGEDLDVWQLTIALGIITTAMAVVGVVILARSAASMAIAEPTEQQTTP